jgi:hypothetical protein
VDVNALDARVGWKAVEHAGEPAYVTNCDWSPCDPDPKMLEGREISEIEMVGYVIEPCRAHFNDTIEEFSARRTY